MYNSDTELLFPIRIISSLGTLRGEQWRGLVERVASARECTPDQLAFVLMMVRMNGCVACNADSFRAMRGCTQCARQNVRRFRGSDNELIEQFRLAGNEVDSFLHKQSPPAKTSED
jgi:hypothetical protein